MNIGLLGMGTIGSGVFEILEKRSDIRVSRVLDLREIAGLEGRLTRRFEDILEDPAIDTVVELLGGLEPAHTFAVRSMQAGKHFVTANKLMVSTHFSELMRVADEAGVEFRFSACVGGGIPYLYNLLRARRADRVLEVGGIVNGTTNLILDTMQSTGADFQEVLLQAQRMGYAEADPSADIDGLDARSKLSISMNLAFDVCIDPAAIPTAGIRHLHKGDVEAFAALGYACRFLTRAVRQEDGRLSAYVEPTLLPASAIEAAVGKKRQSDFLHRRICRRAEIFRPGSGEIPHWIRGRGGFDRHSRPGQASALRELRADRPCEPSGFAELLSAHLRPAECGSRIAGRKPLSHPPAARGRNAFAGGRNAPRRSGTVLCRNPRINTGGQKPLAALTNSSFAHIIGKEKIGCER